MTNNIFIPQKIKVGFQERGDTYTKQLAYVIYYDEKGKLRKEASWDSWRDKKIEPADYDNVPTEGFVLNKKVGGYRSDWNFRQAYVRVYDPRGFEFEITVSNLLYILEQTSSIKGKGLEGEFVYAWEGTELILLPVCAPEYEELTHFNAQRFANETIKAKDLKIGATYLTKNNQQWIYMGRFDYYDRCYSLDGQTFTSWSKLCNYADKNERELYRRSSWGGWNKADPIYEQLIGVVGQYFYFSTDNGFTMLPSISGKLIGIVSEEPAPNYAELFEKLESNPLYSPYDPDRDQYEPDTLDDFLPTGYYGGPRIIRLNDEYQRVEFRHEWYNNEFAGWSLAPRGGSYQISIPGLKYPATAEEIYAHVDAYHINQYLVNGKFYRRTYG